MAAAMYQFARQTGWSSRYARVSVTVEPSSVPGVEVQAHAYGNELWRREAELAARRASHRLSVPHHVTVTDILPTEVDTGLGDIYEATSRAVWKAGGLAYDRFDVGFSELELVERAFGGLIGRELRGVVESHYWYDDRRAGDAESLLQVWLQFGGWPIRLSGSGETLVVSIVDAMKPVDMEECGEIRVGPAQPPDLLAEFVGRRPTAVTTFHWHGYGDCAGLQLDFDGKPLVIGAFGDEWVLARSIPAHVIPHWSPSIP